MKKIIIFFALSLIVFAPFFSQATERPLIKKQDQFFRIRNFIGCYNTEDQAYNALAAHTILVLVAGNFIIHSGVGLSSINGVWCYTITYNDWAPSED